MSKTRRNKGAANRYRNFIHAVHIEYSKNGGSQKTPTRFRAEHRIAACLPKILKDWGFVERHGNIYFWTGPEMNEELVQSITLEAKNRNRKCTEQSLEKRRQDKAEEKRKLADLVENSNPAPIMASLFSELEHFKDEELVNELRNRGWEITAKKEL